MANNQEEIHDDAREIESLGNQSITHKRTAKQKGNTTNMANHKNTKNNYGPNHIPNLRPSTPRKAGKHQLGVWFLFEGTLFGWFERDTKRKTTILGDPPKKDTPIWVCLKMRGRGGLEGSHGRRDFHVVLL